MFREVPMVEVREVLRLWLMGHGLREIARLVQVDRKTVRRYVEAGAAAGLTQEAGEVSDEVLGTVVAQPAPRPTRRPWRGLRGAGGAAGEGWCW